MAATFSATFPKTTAAWTLARINARRERSWEEGLRPFTHVFAPQVVFLYDLAYPERGAQIMATETLDWSDCPLVEVIPGKVSGAPLLKNTRLPVDAITGNYDAFRDEGLSPDEAIAETLDCYPEAGLDAIKAILYYRPEHQFQAQPCRF